MLVLLHFYKLGYSPFTLAFLFLLYEAAGIAANLIGGWLATRYGIARMLVVGLSTQITGFLLLSALSTGLDGHTLGGLGGAVAGCVWRCQRFDQNRQQVGHQTHCGRGLGLASSSNGWPGLLAAKTP
jgi:MFS family permease